MKVRGYGGETCEDMLERILNTCKRYWKKIGMSVWINDVDKFLYWWNLVKIWTIPSLSEQKGWKIEQVLHIKMLLSQYIREAYEHKERKGHPQIAWKLQETVSILLTFPFPFI